VAGGVKHTWHGDEVVATLVATSWENLARATVFFWQQCVEALNVPNTGQSVPKRGGGSRTIYPNPSKPGEPPRKRTGWGQRNVRYELDKARLKSRVGVGVNAMYMAMHEAGIRGVKRPWLLTTLDRHLEQIRALASGRST
jgi:hypothetical protein